MNFSELTGTTYDRKRGVKTMVSSEASVPEVRFGNPFDLLLNQMTTSMHSRKYFGAEDEELQWLLSRIASLTISEQSTIAELARYRKLLERTGDFLGAIRRIRSELCPQALVDEQTETYNQRGFLILGAQLLRIARRIKRPAILLYVDSQKLVETRDASGDASRVSPLTQWATVLNKSFRESDIIARLNGGEFGVLAIETGKECTKDHLLRRLEKNNLAGDSVSIVGRPWVSFGSARSLPDRPVSLAELISLASRDRLESITGVIRGDCVNTPIGRR